MTDITAALPRPKVPICHTAYDAYRLGIGAIFSSGIMFRFFIYGSIMSIAIVGVELLFSFDHTGGTFDINHNYINSLMIGVLSAIILAGIQTPLGIAIQRQILLDDVPQTSYFNYAANPPGRRFFVSSLWIYGAYLVAEFAEVPILAVAGINPLDSDAVAAALKSDVSLTVQILTTTLCAYLAATIFAVRLTFRFPEISCERDSGSTWHALVETKGTAIRLFMLFVLVFLPIGVIYFGALFVAGFVYFSRYMLQGGEMTAEAIDQIMPAMLSSTEFIVAYAVVACTMAFSCVVVAAGAARAYQIRVERGMSGVAEIFS
jgi:hypothetical protein